MIQNPVKTNIPKIGLGTHLGSFSGEDSKQYIDAIIFAVKNGFTMIDTAINYRGMRSEKDVGNAVNTLISSDIIKREDIFIASKAGLLFGDITSGRNPMKYLHEVLEPKGIQLSDFCECEGLYQTLNPDFFEIALQISLQNLGVDTIDVHYIHLPEITRAGLTEDKFYERIAKLFAWYEDKVKEGNIRFYGLALEMLAMEPEEEKWYIDIERVNQIAQEISNESSHFKYIQIPYNIQYPYAAYVQNQSYRGEKCTLVEAAHRMGLKVIGSMPLCCGKGFDKATLEEMISFALNGMDAINVGSKNVKHIQEILDIL
ncbi:MAG: aldo/keto reductase [Lachnospiraceae bacterium]|nr:aldo/keto reductase [Lachnospiraceae bacterium]